MGRGAFPLPVPSLVALGADVAEAASVPAAGTVVETLVIAKPQARWKAGASAANDSLVREQNGCAVGEGSYKYLYVQVPSLRPGRQIEDGSLGDRLLLGDDNVAVPRGRVVREAECERGCRTRAIPCRIQRLRQ